MVKVESSTPPRSDSKGMLAFIISKLVCTEFMNEENASRPAPSRYDPMSAYVRKKRRKMKKNVDTATHGIDRRTVRPGGRAWERR